jgi:hypothetical protein
MLCRYTVLWIDRQCDKDQAGKLRKDAGEVSDILSAQAFTTDRALLFFTTYLLNVPAGNVPGRLIDD